MTGLDRLRGYARRMDELRVWPGGARLREIADQIERERACDADTIENLRLELDEARDEAAWVREHGGLDSVKELLDWVVGHCSTKQQLDFDFWLSGRVMYELGFEEDMADRDEVERRLLARLMPEGMEWLLEAWPRFDDDSPVRIGDEISWKDDGGKVNSIELQDGGYFILHAADGAEDWILPQYFPGERVRRPAPKVLDADGVEMDDGRPLREGETVWDVESGIEYEVVGIHTDEDSPVRVMRTDGSHLAKAAKPSTLTHERPVLNETRRQRRDSVPRAAYERNLAKRQRQIDESHAALRRRNRWIAELEHLLCKEMSYSLRRDAGCLAPEVLDADGVEIREGDTVWHVESGEQCKVVEVDSRSVSVDFRVDGDGTKHTGSILPANLTHRAPVIAADGEPLREGETVWDTNGDELVIGALEDGGHTVTCRYADVGDAIPVHGMWSPSDLTHERPVADTWERLEEDAKLSLCEYNLRNKPAAGDGTTLGEDVRVDLVRRARVLAERGRGE